MSDTASNPSWPPKMAVCVGTVVMQDDRILMIRQAKGHTLAGHWSIPWGLVDEGETPEDAALRETWEEAGIRAEIAGLLGVQNLPTPGWIALVFLCRHLAGTPRPDGTETDRAAYLSLHNLDALPDPIEPWCKWLAARALTGACTLTPEAPAGNPMHPRKAFL